MARPIGLRRRHSVRTLGTREHAGHPQGRARAETGARKQTETVGGTDNGRSGAIEGGLPRSASLRASATERQVSALAIVSGALPTRPARRHRPGVSKRRASWAIVVVTGCLSSWRSISLE